MTDESPMYPNVNPRLTIFCLSVLELLPKPHILHLATLDRWPTTLWAESRMVPGRLRNPEILNFSPQPRDAASVIEG